VDEFLGYFMVRKVMAGQDLLRSAGTVTKKLAVWLHEHGHAGETARDVAAARGVTASRDLPRAERLANLLYEQRRATAAVDRAMLGPGDIVGEDLPLQIERVEPGKLYFTGVDGPLRVPRQASDLASPGWDVTIILIRKRGTWDVLDCNFSPSRCCCRRWVGWEGQRWAQPRWARMPPPGRCPGLCRRGPWAVAGGFGATLVIGAVAGLYPAFRAARVSPTTALHSF
jgi:hypothetical protein